MADIMIELMVRYHYHNSPSKPKIENTKIKTIIQAAIEIIIKIGIIKFLIKLNIFLLYYKSYHKNAIPIIIIIIATFKQVITEISFLFQQ